VQKLLADLRAWIQQGDGTPYISDRRLTQAVKLLKVAAFASGRTEVHDDPVSSKLCAAAETRMTLLAGGAA
jgi:hypothetical protein